MSVGKNFSCANRGQRKKSDFYETPFSMTQQLLDVEPFDFAARTLEPACGNGAIIKVLTDGGFKRLSYYDKETNFLLEKTEYSQIITNPPFSLATEFILKAKEVCTKKFALLLPLSYLHGKKRLDLIYKDTDFSLARVHVFCRYPMLGDALRADGKYKTGMMVYAWFVWEKGKIGNPEIDWIDNTKFVIGSRHNAQERTHE